MGNMAWQFDELVGSSQMKDNSRVEVRESAKNRLGPKKESLES